MAQSAASLFQSTNSNVLPDTTEAMTMTKISSTTRSIGIQVSLCQCHQSITSSSEVPPGQNIYSSTTTTTRGDCSDDKSHNPLRESNTTNLSTTISSIIHGSNTTSTTTSVNNRSKEAGKLRRAISGASYPSSRVESRYNRSSLGSSREMMENSNRSPSGGENEPGETTRLLPQGQSQSQNDGHGGNDSVPTTPKEKFSESSINSSPTEKSPLRREASTSSASHTYQNFKRKFNFRSDSVFSDVMPMQGHSHEDSSGSRSRKNSEDPGREKSGSLSCLKPPIKEKESKWVALRRKLSKVNTSKSEKKEKSSKESLRKSSGGESGTIQEDGEVGVGVGGEDSFNSNQQMKKKQNKKIPEKRSLLKRAKTLSILPVNSNKEHKEKRPEPPKRILEPPELFNVGGEMNMIPLEYLININDLAIKK